MLFASSHGIHTLRLASATSRRLHGKGGSEYADSIQLGIEALENRDMFAATVTFQTSFGSFDVELFDDVAPATVANFLNYVNRGDYRDSIFHRSVPGFIVQGGGFKTDFSRVNQVGPVVNEFQRSNVRGTIAMAKLGGDPNSATNQWFFNLANNSANLDNQNGGFTVFGQVLGNGMAILDQIAALPRFNFSQITAAGPNRDAFTDLPLSNYTQANLPTLPTTQQLVRVTDIALKPTNGNTASISGQIFDDRNANGVRDTNELGIAGRQVFLDANNNGFFDSGERNTLTNSNGEYTLLELPAGNYVVRPTKGLNTASTTAISANVTLTQGQRRSAVDFGQTDVNSPNPVALNAISDTGISASDRITRRNNADASNNLVFTVNGVTPGATVRLNVSGLGQIAEGVATGSSITLTTNGTLRIPDGSRAVTATQTLAGQTSPNSQGVIVTIDTTAPVSTANAPDATANNPYSFTASSTDANGPLQYALVSGPLGLTISSTTAAVSWTPSIAQVGAATFTVRATDSAGNSSERTYNLNVRAPNQRPLALADVYEAVEDVTLDIPALRGVLVNDNDPESNPITAVVRQPPANGQLTLNADGSFRYIPKANFNGRDSFTYAAQDAFGASDAVRVDINVLAQPDLPQGVADRYAFQEGRSLIVSALQGLLANDINLDNAQLRVELITPPASGELQLREDGSFTFTPPSGFSGVTSFSYRLVGGGAGEAAVSVTLTGVAVNDPPVGAADLYSVNEDEVLAVGAATGVLKNDSDPDSANLRVQIAASPTHGQLLLNPDGSFQYIPGANFFGQDQFSYRISDGENLSEPVVVTIEVVAVDDAPEFLNVAPITIAVGSPLSLQTRLQDLDSNLNGFFYQLDQGAPAGLVIDPVTGNLTWAPDASFLGLQEARVLAISTLNGETLASLELQLNVTDTGLQIFSRIEGSGEASFLPPPPIRVSSPALTQLPRSVEAPSTAVTEAPAPQPLIRFAMQLARKREEDDVDADTPLNPESKASGEADEAETEANRTRNKPNTSSNSESSATQEETEAQATSSDRQASAHSSNDPRQKSEALPEQGQNTHEGMPAPTLQSRFSISQEAWQLSAWAFEKSDLKTVNGQSDPTDFSSFEGPVVSDASLQEDSLPAGPIYSAASLVLASVLTWPAKPRRKRRKVLPGVWEPLTGEI